MDFAINRIGPLLDTQQDAALGVKCSPKLGQQGLEFSGVRLMPAGAPMSHSIVTGMRPPPRHREIRLRYSLA